MKILVMSLLRIGDIVLSASLMRGLRESHPDAEIHLLLNSQFRQIEPLMPYVNRFIYFEREILQRGLGDAAIPVFDSFDRLADFVDSLNGVEYDWTINLTHNRLSGWLTSLISTKKRSGLSFDSQGRASFGTSWFKYLNDQVDEEGGEVFHFADIFRFALGLSDVHSQRAALVETVKGRDEAEKFLNELGREKFVVVQALTSDRKKDWGFERFAQAIIQIQRVNPDVGFAILGAPFERDRLTPFVEGLNESGIRAHLAVLSFEGAFSLLRKAKLALTGDTSIKHLANAARAPVLEISLGSSDHHRTGAYGHGSVIIQSRESCAPCVHSKPCHRDHHACAGRIPVDVVAMVASEVLSGRTFQLRNIAEAYREEVDILRVESRAADFRAAYSVLESVSEDSIGRWVDLACRKIWLDYGDEKAVDCIGTETLCLSRLLRTIHPDVSEIEWRHLFGEFERQAIAAYGRVNSFKVGIKYLHGCYEDPRRMKEFVRGLISFRERIRHAPLLRTFKSALDRAIEDDISPAFTRFRRINDLVNEIEHRTAIHLRLIRGLSQAGEFEKGLEKT